MFTLIYSEGLTHTFCLFVCVCVCVCVFDDGSVTFKCPCFPSEVASASPKSSCPIIDAST